MRPDGAGSAGGVGLIHPQPVVEPRRRIEPEPAFEPRPHVRPEPVFEPRLRLQGPAGAADTCPPCPQVAPPAEAEAAARPSSPVEPPWKVLPWEREPVQPPPRPVRKIKVFVTRPDTYCKGSVIDLFI